MISLSLPAGLNKVAVALSGGPDSWALTLLTQEWCRTNNAQITALTVDHQLRPESTAEAAAIADECKKRGTPHKTLVWQHAGVTSAMQEQAREARYRLLTNYCRQNNISVLLVAHHADDQYETVLMRLAKASDVGGLGGLSDTVIINNITILRPLLRYRKQQLIDFVQSQGITFFTDASNSKPDFARGRLRSVESALAAEGLTVSTITKLSAKMRAADDALDYAAKRLITCFYAISPLGIITAPLSAFVDKPAALQQRAVQALWRLVTGSTGHPLGSDQTAALVHFLLSSEQTRVTTGGMIIEKSDTTITAYREPAACQDIRSVPAGGSITWDSRFEICNPTGQAINIGKLGSFGRDKIAKLPAEFLCLGDIPALARESLPAAVLGAATVPIAFFEATSGPFAQFLPIKSKKKATQPPLYSA